MRRSLQLPAWPAVTSRHAQPLTPAEGVAHCVYAARVEPASADMCEGYATSHDEGCAAGGSGVLPQLAEEITPCKRITLVSLFVQLHLSAAATASVSTTSSHSPQQKAWPVARSMPHVCEAPALICVKSVVPDTLTGMLLLAVVPSPSWPSLFHPAGQPCERICEPVSEHQQLLVAQTTQPKAAPHPSIRRGLLC